MARKGSWQVHAGENTRLAVNQEKTGGNQMSTLGNDETTGSCFLQKALAIAASSYPSPLNKYEIPTSPQPEIRDGASGVQD